MPQKFAQPSPTTNKIIVCPYKAGSFFYNGLTSSNVMSGACFMVLEL